MLFSLTIRGILHEYSHPAVMGILNATPDSFFSGSRAADERAVMQRAELMVAEGADFIDVGAYSTRPGHGPVSETEELRRLETALEAVRRVDAAIPVSVDTFRASVARRAVTEMGADIVNDVSSGSDPEMWHTVALTKAPYILTNARCDVPGAGDDAVACVLRDLADKTVRLRLLGVNDVLVDPGFGLGKTLDQNYALLSRLQVFAALQSPVLAGISRKSMITGLLGISADEALNGTTALHMAALQRGASVLRVHDVAAAVQTVRLHDKLTCHCNPAS